MIRTDYAVRMLQAVAAVLGLAILAWSMGLPGFTGRAHAVQVTEASDTLSNSAPGAASDHTIRFETLNGLSIGQTIVLTFDDETPSAFNLGSLTVADIDLTTGTGPETDQTLAGAAGAGTWGVTIDSGADTITFETPTDASVASSTQINIYIGQVGPNGGTNRIVNPNATGSYPVLIGGTMQDSGEVRVAIIESVTVTASVDTVFDFTVLGVNSGEAVNGSPTTTVAASSPISLPFGELDTNVSATLAHDLQVVTNAANGFSVTVEQSGEMLSSTGADINSFIDGAYTNTPTAWTAPSAVVGDDTTYGHWGVTSDDPDFSATPDRWVAASTTPRVVFSNSTVSDGTLTGSGTTRIGYQIQISPLQEAGNDYSTTLTYIATPTF
jgi:hypothetical protein